MENKIIQALTDIIVNKMNEQEANKKTRGRPQHLTKEQKKENKKISNQRKEEIERRKEYSKKYYKLHHIPKLKHQDSIACACGGYYLPHNKIHHFKTIKHSEHVKNLNI